MLNTMAKAKLFPIPSRSHSAGLSFTPGMRLGNVGEGASSRQSCILEARTRPIGFSLATKGSCWEPEFSVTGGSNPPEMLKKVPIGRCQECHACGGKVRGTV